MLEKLKFWKKKDDFMSDPLPGDPMMQSPSDPLASQDPTGQFPPADPMATPANPMGQTPQGPPQMQDHVQQEFGQESHMASFGSGNAGQMEPAEHDDHRDRDTELILAKLDAIKAELDSMHQRVRQLEGKEQRRTW